MNKFLLLCLLAGVLHALPSKYLKILSDLIIPKICKKKLVSFQILNIIDIFLLFFFTVFSFQIAERALYSYIIDPQFSQYLFTAS